MVTMKANRTASRRTLKERTRRRKFLRRMGLNVGSFIGNQEFTGIKERRGGSGVLDFGEREG